MALLILPEFNVVRLEQRGCEGAVPSLVEIFCCIWYYEFSVHNITSYPSKSMRNNNKMFI